jgi:hypothetical protein
MMPPKPPKPVPEPPPGFSRDAFLGDLTKATGPVKKPRAPKAKPVRKRSPKKP